MKELVTMGISLSSFELFGCMFAFHDSILVHASLHGFMAWSLFFVAMLSALRCSVYFASVCSDHFAGGPACNVEDELHLYCSLRWV